MPPRLVKFPPTITVVDPSFVAMLHMARIAASDAARVAKAPLGNCDNTAWLPFVLNPFSVWPWNWYSEMPSKSPASPTWPRLERSTLVDGIVVNVIARATGAREVNRRPSRKEVWASRSEGLRHERSFMAGPGERLRSYRAPSQRERSSELSYPVLRFGGKHAIIPLPQMRNDRIVAKHPRRIQAVSRRVRSSPTTGVALIEWEEVRGEEREGPEDSREVGWSTSLRCRTVQHWSLAIQCRPAGRRL
jgi:hypothetical protein